MLSPWTLGILWNLCQQEQEWEKGVDHPIVTVVLYGLQDHSASNGKGLQCLCVFLCVHNTLSVP